MKSYLIICIYLGLFLFSDIVFSSPFSDDIFPILNDHNRLDDIDVRRVFLRDSIRGREEDRTRLDFERELLDGLNGEEFSRLEFEQEILQGFEGTDLNLDFENSERLVSTPSSSSSSSGNAQWLSDFHPILNRLGGGDENQENKRKREDDEYPENEKRRKISNQFSVLVKSDQTEYSDKRCYNPSFFFLVSGVEDVNIVIHLPTKGSGLQHLCHRLGEVLSNIKKINGIETVSFEFVIPILSKGKTPRSLIENLKKVQDSIKEFDFLFMKPLRYISMDVKFIYNESSRGLTPCKIKSEASRVEVVNFFKEHYLPMFKDKINAVHVNEYKGPSTYFYSVIFQCSVEKP